MEENSENIQNNENTENKENTNTTKNNKWIIISIVIASVVVLLLAGYFLFNKGVLERKNIVGYYELYEMTSGDQSYSNEEIKNLQNLGLHVSLELKEDKTGKLEYFGQTMDLTYDNKNMTVEGKSSPYKVEKDKVSMEQDGDKLVFQKTQKTENTEQQK